MRTLANKSLQPTCYPCDYSTVTEDGKLFDGSSRDGKARTRLNSALHLMKPPITIAIIWFALLWVLFVFAAPLTESLFIFYLPVHWAVFLAGCVIAAFASATITPHYSCYLLRI